jgi:phasin family protein
MAQGPMDFMDMFKSFGEQLKLPQVDTSKIVAQHQKNIEAMTKSWQAMASGATEIANKQREIFEAMLRDLGEVVKEYKPGGDAQEIIAKQTAFASKALEAAMANTRDIAELLQKSSAEAMKIVQDRMTESYEEIRSGLDRK